MYHQGLYSLRQPPGLTWMIQEEEVGVGVGGEFRRRC